MKSLFEILGVSQNASKKQLNAAYRELAKKYHPDRNPDDPEAEEQFKLISRAYEVLADPDKRAKYLLWKEREDASEQAAAQPQRRPQAIRPEPFKVKGLYLYIFGGMTVFIFLCFLFYQQMEVFAAKEILAEAETLYYVNPDKANSLLRLALEKDPSLSEAHFMLAQQLLETSEGELSALFHLEQAINNSEKEVAKYFFERGKLRQQLDDPIAALSDLEKAMVLQPNYPTVAQRIGNIYLFHLNQAEKALSFFDHALRISAQDDRALLGKAIALQDLKQYQQSSTYLLQVKMKKPQWAEVPFYLGIDALEHLKDTVLACGYWHDAHALGSGNARIAIKKYCTE